MMIEEQENSQARLEKQLRQEHEAKTLAELDRDRFASQVTLPSFHSESIGLTSRSKLNLMTSKVWRQSWRSKRHNFPFSINQYSPSHGVMNWQRPKRLKYLTSLLVNS